MRSISVRPFACAVLVAALSAFSGCGGGGTAGGVTSAVATPTEVSAAGSGFGSAATTAQALRNGPTRSPPIVKTEVSSPTLTVRAHGQLAGGFGPVMQVYVNGVLKAAVEVRASAPQDYVMPLGLLRSGDKLDLVYDNDEAIAGQDRNLFISYLTDGRVFVFPYDSGVILDAGVGPAAVDGQAVSPGTGALWGNSALRLTWPSLPTNPDAARDFEASRFLQQATFGPTREAVQALRNQAFSAWITQQMAMPAQPGYLSHVQAMYDQGADFQPPNGAHYSPDWLGNRFWTEAATSPEQLRRRVAFALHSIFVVSQADSNLYHQARAYASFQDQLVRQAFGNFRDLLEDVALSPAMGLYLSHMRNLKEDPNVNRLPDENFARELMQLFTIGLHVLNADGTEKLDSQGRPMETYSNKDVMALAKVFTGFSWGLDDGQLTEANFRWGMPESRTTGAARADIRRMKPYPGLTSVAEKRLFAGSRAAEMTIPAGTSPTQGVQMALDALFNHPNVGPFIGKQLIQRLVTSNPSPAYVSRVAAVFNDNGNGKRGDLAAVVRAILLDNEARGEPDARFGKLREPVLRVSHWMRSFDARSASGQYQLVTEPHAVGQRLNYMPSVFGYFRPGYTAPNSPLSVQNLLAPEMQIVDESSSASWINAVELMLVEGIGWTGSTRDVKVDLTYETALLATSPMHLLDHLDLYLFAGRMSSTLRKLIVDAMAGVPEASPGRDAARARVALFVAMTSSEYLVER